jgi:hypothetical protein
MDYIYCAVAAEETWLNSLNIQDIFLCFQACRLALDAKESPIHLVPRNISP